ncbi:MAG: type II toxin-antitoxin system Phd/YefM family antitoxin [Spirochaetia bacterium]|jgi:PHD/YefM family antitoxin component YafN of YafNO toxin-antitoxin module|nr:type II toxin-antitoxin system Phd/YefM family antitoxin [Spirochaetia bacterium]
MVEMTVTEFSRNLSTVFDRIEYKHEEIILVRHNHRIARVIPGSFTLTALEAMGDLYRTLPEDAGKDWLKDSTLPGNLDNGMRDLWDV